MTQVPNPAIQAAEIIDAYADQVSADAIRRRLYRYYLEHGEWPHAGGLAVDVRAESLEEDGYIVEWNPEEDT